MSESKIRGPVETKNRQKIIAIAIFGGFFGIIMIALWVSDPNRNKPTEEYVSQRGTLAKDYRSSPSRGVSDEEHWILQSQEDMGQLRKDAEAKDKQIETLLSRIEKLEKESSSSVERLQNDLRASQDKDQRALENLNKLLKASDKNGKQQSTPVNSTKVNNLNKRLPPPPQVSQRTIKNERSNAGKKGAKTDYLNHISLKQNDKSKEKKKQELAKNISRYLPTGTLSKGVFLTGVDAPTGGSAQGNPHPVLVRVKSFGNLPNFAQSYIKDCHILGAATGNISSERVEIRLETLTCILKDGGILEVPVKGYVTGEDGKMGMRGRVVEKQGQLIARAMVAGGLGGISTAFSQQHSTVASSALGTTTTYDPDKIGQSGAGIGIGTALNKLADYYFKRLNEMYPVIEMDAGRICDIILTGGTDLKHKIIGNTYDALD